MTGMRSVRFMRRATLRAALGLIALVEDRTEAFGGRRRIRQLDALILHVEHLDGAVLHDCQPGLWLEHDAQQVLARIFTVRTDAQRPGFGPSHQGRTERSTEERRQLARRVTDASQALQSSGDFIAARARPK